MTSHDYLGAALLNSLWQAPLIALAGCLLLRAVPRVSASTRYAVWLTALIGCAFFPPLTTPMEISLRIPEGLLQAIEIAWVAGAAILLARTGLAAQTLSRIKRLAYPLDVPAREGLTLWNNRGLTHRDVRLCVSTDVDTPVAIGLFDDLILLPEWLVNSLPVAELDRLAMHELAHLERYDDWTKLLQNILASLMFFNPAVRWISVQAEVEREVACDDAAVQAGSDAITYAESLTRLARAVSWASRFSLAPSLFAARRTLSRRVERLLQPAIISRSFSRPAATSYAAILLATFFAIRALTPVATQAFTLPPDDGAVHTRVAALYDDMRRGRYHGNGFGRAETVLRQLGPITSLRINHVLSVGATMEYFYDVRTSHGSASMRVRMDSGMRISAFTVNVNGTLEDGRYLRAFMTTEPRSKEN